MRLAFMPEEERRRLRKEAAKRAKQERKEATERAKQERKDAERQQVTAGCWGRGQCGAAGAEAWNSVVFCVVTK